MEKGKLYRIIDDGNEYKGLFVIEDDGCFLFELDEHSKGQLDYSWLGTDRPSDVGIYESRLSGYYYYFRDDAQFYEIEESEKFYFLKFGNDYVKAVCANSKVGLYELVDDPQKHGWPPETYHYDSDLKGYNSKYSNLFWYASNTMVFGHDPSSKSDNKSSSTAVNFKVKSLYLLDYRGRTVVGEYIGHKNNGYQTELFEIVSDLDNTNIGWTKTKSIIKECDLLRNHESTIGKDTYWWFEPKQVISFYTTEISFLEPNEDEKEDSYIQVPLLLGKKVAKKKINLKFNEL